MAITNQQRLAIDEVLQKYYRRALELEEERAEMLAIQFQGDAFPPSDAPKPPELDELNQALPRGMMIRIQFAQVDSGEYDRLAVELWGARADARSPPTTVLAGTHAYLPA
ncbi:MAG: hypothetical protein R3B96_11720 [Pirellulaceae bacterium]